MADNFAKDDVSVTILMHDAYLFVFLMYYCSAFEEQIYLHFQYASSFVPPNLLYNIV